MELKFSLLLNIYGAFICWLSTSAVGFRPFPRLMTTSRKPSFILAQSLNFTLSRLKSNTVDTTTSLP